MCHRKCGGLLRERESEFPDQNNGGVNEDRKRSVLKFTGEIAADPRVRAQQRQMTLGPTTRHVGKNRNDRDLVIVIPKKKRIMPEQDKTKTEDRDTGENGSEEIATPIRGGPA